MKKYTSFLVVTLGICFSTTAQNISGIDVSAIQGTINWSQVSMAGKVFAFAKATKGTSYVDTRFFSNMTNGSSAGIKMGTYHFALPEQNSATSEANYFLNASSPYIGAGFLPPVLDLEDPAGDFVTNFQSLTTYFSSNTLTTWVQTWLTTVQNATGVTPIIYTTASIASYLNSSLNGYKLWIANPGTSQNTPPTNIGNWTTWAFKQYGQGSVSGITGNVDLDVFHGTQSSFDSLLGTNTQPDLIPINQSVSSTTIPANSSFNAYCKEKNYGNVSASANIVSVYLSSDGVLTPGSNGDTYLGFINFPNIGANITSSQYSNIIQMPSNVAPGSYYLFFWADGGQVVPENNENNNFSTIQISVTGSSQTYNVATSSSPVGWGTTTGSGNYSAGQQVTVAATNNSGYTFVNWTENGSQVTSNASYTFNLTQNRSLVANFSACNYSLSTTSISIYSQAQNQSFWVYTSSDCNWTATTTGCSGMITLINATGNGNGMVTFNVSANTNTAPRSCTIIVGGQTITINQAGYVAPCSTTPATPNGLSGGYISCSPHQNYLSWSGSSANVTNFELERGTSSTGPFSLIASTGTNFSYLDSLVSSGTTYYYRVRACCNGNCSGYSNIYSMMAKDYSTAATAIIASKDTICLGDSVFLAKQGGSAGTGATWTWRLNQCNSGTLVGNGTSIWVHPTTSGNYVLKAEGADCGFVACAIKYITVKQPPTTTTISANGTTSFCQGGNTILSGNSNLGVWSNNSTLSSITVTTDGDYFVTNSNTCGITVSNHILVTVNQPPVADFAASQTSGNCPFNVDFFNLSTSSPTANYLWTFYTGGAPITSTLENPIGILYNIAGSYLVKLDVTDSCGTNTKTVASYITVNCQTGINEIRGLTNIIVYPNPVGNLLHVDNLKEGASYRMVNLIGSIIQQGTVQIGSNEISLEEIPAGIYLLQLTNNVAQREVVRVVKE